MVLFDGVCNLCDRSVQFVLHHDRKGEFRFASLQSAAARSLVGEATASGLGSVLLVDEAGVHTKSEAALRIAARLGAPWSWLSVFRLVPRPIRDGVYGFVARNRYRWFGRKDACPLPPPDVRARFLDAGEGVP